MPRYNFDIHNLLGESSKIRKRGSTTSSSSSSVMHSYRFKRAVVVNKKGGYGASTPLPTWRITQRSPKITESPKYPPSFKGKQHPQVSARKLAASLWEINGAIPSSSRLEDGLQGMKKETRGRGKKGGSTRSGSLQYSLSDPSHSPVSQRTQKSKNGSVHRRSSRPQLSDRYNGGFDSMSNAGLMEVEGHTRGRTPPGSIVGVKTSLKDVSSGLMTSKELLRILNRVWGVEEYHSSAKSLMSALCSELDRLHSQVDQLIHERRSDNKEINYLMKHLAEEKAAWKSKMQERVKAAVKAISGDLEMERKLRRRTESLNKTLARELAETKIALSKAVKELEGEKRSREIVEEACNELARGIGEDRAMVEKMKRESEKVLEDVEKEREMLHVADVLREERVQMKLLEAKYQFEEKNAAVENLKNELEVFLKNKKAKENKRRKGKDVDEIEAGEAGKDLDSEEDSDDSDLHSIELNMDNNSSQMWSYAVGEPLEDPKRRSTEKKTKGRKSTSEKIAKGRNSLERYMADALEWDLRAQNLPRGDGFGLGRHFNLERQSHEEDTEEDAAKDYKTIKDLRDHILASSISKPSRGVAIPTRGNGATKPVFKAFKQ